MRVLTASEFQQANEAGRICFEDILILERSPRDIESAISGAATAERQGDLSHLRIRTANRGTPNAYVQNALQEFEPWDGQLVRLEVLPAQYQIRAATIEEAQEFWDTSRPSLSQLPSSDPSFNALRTLREIAELDSIESQVERFGGKATNLARLQLVLDLSLIHI